MKNCFTTAEAANICLVSMGTVWKCIQNGLLVAHRMPPRGRWKITRKELLKFAKEHGLEHAVKVLEGEQCVN